jgi:cytochrome c oxidase cbb3-type subunit 2
MRFSFLFAGIFATFASAWVGLTLVPYAQLANLQPKVDEETGDIYPVNNAGIAAQGRKVYVANGCIYCHTQMVRAGQSGSDLDRGWGRRRTVARDYIYDNPPVLGVMRNGPDLANIGNTELVDPTDEPPQKRWKDAAWHYAHLYNPRGKVQGSIMPSFRFLFEKRKIAGERSAEALNLEGEDAVPDGYEVVPTSQARALVGYLLSLDRSHPLNEVKQEAPAK